MKVANEIGVPWRAAERMHWELGEQEMAGRVNVPTVTRLGSSSDQVAAPQDFHPDAGAEVAEESLVRAAK